MIYRHIESPIGRLLLAGKDAAVLELLGFPEGSMALAAEPGWTEDDTAFAEAARQLAEYFDGSRQEFELDLEPSGTAFQQSVWSALRDIPYGETISYAELARRVGNPKASRAVGAANGRNPIPVIIPCHRVIGANGSLTGFGGGLPTKQFLLGHEQQQAFELR